MGEYIPGAPINDDVKKHNQNLPGMGGVFNYVNLHVYHYAGNNPINLTDPDGRSETEDTAQGRDIHVMILARYRIAHSGEHVEGGYTSMSTVLADMDKIDKGQGRTDIGLKPDIWNVTTGDVYEIKPIREDVRSAKEQAVLYVSLLQKFGGNAQLGNSGDPAVSGTFNYKDKVVTSTQSGTILYTVVSQKRQEILEPVTKTVAVTAGAYLAYKVLRAIAVGLAATPPVGLATLLVP